MEKAIVLPEFVGPDYKAHWRDDLNDETYHSDKTAVSSSGARLMLKSPRAFYRGFCLGKKKPPTPAMNFGKAAHMAMLEPQRFKDTYVVQPDFGDLRSPTNRSKRDAWRLGLPKGSEVISEEEHDKLVVMVHALLDYDIASNMLKGAVFEASGFFRDPVTGLKCRIRPDILQPSLAVMPDLKTCKDPSKREFQKVIWSKGYYFQLAFYRLGVKEILGREPVSTPFIAIQNEEPHDICVYDPDDGMMSRGDQAVRFALDKIAHCAKEGFWPGMQNGSPDGISLPPWTDQIEEE